MTSSHDPSVTTSANSRTWLVVRATSPTSRSTGMPVSSCAIATSWSRSASTAAASAHNIEARVSRSVAARMGAALHARETAVSTVAEILVFVSLTFFYIHELGCTGKLQFGQQASSPKVESRAHVTLTADTAGGPAVQRRSTSWPAASGRTATSRRLLRRCSPVVSFLSQSENACTTSPPVQLLRLAIVPGISWVRDTRLHVLVTYFSK